MKNLHVTKTLHSVQGEGLFKKGCLLAFAMLFLFQINASAVTTYTVLAMRTTLIDKAPTSSQSVINDMLFTNSKGVKKFWEDSSYGQATWTGTVIDVSIPYSTTDGSSYAQWCAAAESAARAQGYEPNNYTAKMTMVGIGSQGGVGGWTTGDGGTSRVIIYDCRDMNATAHELGHCISLAHSSTDANNDGVIDAEYGDNSCIMGGGTYHLNAPQSVKKGWLSPTTITANGSYTVAPLENTSGTRVFKYVPPTGNPYFFSYRQPIGFDANTTWHDGGGKSPIGAPFTTSLSIHRHDGQSQSLLITTIGDTGSFTIPGTSVVITQNSHNSSGATFTVSGISGISGTHRIVNVQSGKAIDNGSSSLGAGCVQWAINDVSGGGQQKWTFTQNSDTSWNIINVMSGYAMEMQATTNGAQAKVWSANGGSNQRWWVDRQSDGTYKIWNQWSGKALENASSTQDGTPIIQWDWSGGNWQRWSLQ